MDIYIDFKNYKKEEAEFKRTAARAIVPRGNEFLMITSKFGDAKFPGGGKENNENLLKALIREMREETGYQVLKDSVKKYGVITEKRVSRSRPGVMVMDSHYFICEVQDEAAERLLEPYEIEFRYENTWMTLEEAIKRNKQITNTAECPWVTREIAVMEHLKNS